MIKVSDLKKTFDSFQLSIRDLEIKEGSAVAILGSNGSGKTTLLNLISGLTSANSGELIFYKKQPTIGYVCLEHQLIKRLTVKENIELFGSLSGMETIQINKRIKQLESELSLHSIMGKKAKVLSTGEGQRARLARSIVKPPDILILDEPTSGIDIQGIENVLVFLERMKSAGVTILLATHHIYEVERLCDRAVYMDAGSIAKDVKVISSDTRKSFGLESLTMSVTAA